MNHQCASHIEWLSNHHYFCSCGHVEWAHYGNRMHKAQCMHCNCKQYNGEIRPLIEYEIQSKHGI